MATKLYRRVDKLKTLLNNRNIKIEVYYSRKRPVGWMGTIGGSPQRLGYNFEQAVNFIESGTLDFLVDFIERGLEV